MLAVAIEGEKVVKSMGGDTLKKNVELQKQAKTETDKLVEAQKKLEQAKTNEAKQLASINLLIQQQNAANKAFATTTALTAAEINKEATSIAGARAQMALLTQARNNVNITTEEGRAKLLMLNDALDKNNAFIKANGDAALKQKMSIGDYATGMQTAIENTGLFNGKLGTVTQTAIGFVQQGAQAAQKIKDINDSVVSGAGKLGNYVTAKLGFVKAEKLSNETLEAGTVITEANATATVEAEVAKIGFVQAEKATKAATVASTVATEASIAANEEMAVAQAGVTASSEVMAVAEAEATVATTALDIALGVLLSPITLVIAAAAALLFVFKDFAPLINPIKDAFAALMAVFNVIKQDIFDLVTGARSLGDIFFSFGEDASKAAGGAMDLAKATRELNKAMEINDVAMAQAKTKIQELILQSKNRTLSEQERVKLIQQAQNIEEAAFKKTNDLNERDIQNKRDKLFEGKKLSAEELKFIEANDFAKIRSLKISKNLNDDDLKAYAETLKKKESLLQEDQQIREKAENRKDQLADKAKEKADKAEEKAKKNAEDEEKRKEKAVQDELNRRKKSAEIAINAMKLTLDNEMAFYEQEKHLQDDNLAHIEAVSAMKIAIANAEMQKNLIGIAKGSIEEKQIVEGNRQDIVKINAEKQKAINDVIKDGKKFELELYDANTKLILDQTDHLTDKLIQAQKDRIKESLELHKQAMRDELGIDKDTTDEKLKLYEKTNAVLTAGEKKYLAFIKTEEAKEAKDSEKLDKTLLDVKLKNNSDEEKDSIRHYKTLQKGTLANNIFELKEEEKRIKKDLALAKAGSIEEKRLQDDLTLNQQKQNDLVQASKQKGLQDSLSMFIDFVGKESELGKVAAVAQATINTYVGATKALEDYPAPYSYIVAGLTIANGLRTVAQIEGIGLFAEGTDDAPYTGKAIAHEKGAELHFDKHGNLKSLGSDKGAQVIDIVKGDKIIPADISAIIKQTMFKSYGMNDKQVKEMDYDKLGQSVGKYMGKHTDKITRAIVENATKSIILPKDMKTRATFKGGRV